MSNIMLDARAECSTQGPSRAGTQADQLHELRQLRESSANPQALRRAENELLARLGLDGDFKLHCEVALEIIKTRALPAKQFKRLTLSILWSGNFSYFSQIAEHIPENSDGALPEIRVLYGLLEQELSRPSDQLVHSAAVIDAWTEASLEIVQAAIKQLREQREESKKIRSISQAVIDSCKSPEGKKHAAQLLDSQAGFEGTGSVERSHRNVQGEVLAHLLQQSYFDAAVNHLEEMLEGVMSEEIRLGQRLLLVERLLGVGAADTASQTLNNAIHLSERAGLPRSAEIDRLLLVTESSKLSPTPPTPKKQLVTEPDEVLCDGLLEHYRVCDQRCLIIFRHKKTADSGTSMELQLLVTLLCNQGISVLVVRCRNRFRGLLGLDYELGGRTAAQQTLRDELARLKYQHFAFLGLSLFGVSAVLYAIEMQADGALVFSPQTILPEISEVKGFRKALAAGLHQNIDHRDLVPLLLNSNAIVHAYYDETNAFDTQHAERLRATPNVRLFKEEHHSHNVLWSKIADGSMASVVAAFVRDLGWAVNA